MSEDTTVYDNEYPARRLLDVVGNRWTPIVIFILGRGTKRYGEMQRHLPDISKKMLTQTLRALEEDGLLKRTVYAQVPPRVDYELTALGRVYLEPVTALCRWATKHIKELEVVESNRERARQGTLRREGKLRNTSR